MSATIPNLLNKAMVDCGADILLLKLVGGVAMEYSDQAYSASLHQRIASEYLFLVNKLMTEEISVDTGDSINLDYVPGMKSFDNVVSAYREYVSLIISAWYTQNFPQKDEVDDRLFLRSVMNTAYLAIKNTVLDNDYVNQCFFHAVYPIDSKASGIDIADDPANNEVVVGLSIKGFLDFDRLAMLNRDKKLEDEIELYLKPHYFSMENTVSKIMAGLFSNHEARPMLMSFGQIYQEREIVEAGFWGENSNVDPLSKWKNMLNLGQCNFTGSDIDEEG